MATGKSKRDVAEKRKNKSTKIFKGVFHNIMKYMFLSLRYYFEMLVDLIFASLWEGTKQPLPPLEGKHAILTESAVTLANKIRNKELKSVDLVTACIERIKQVNPVLNAMTDERFDEALKEAQEVDRMMENDLPEQYFKLKPFLGVPFTTKDSTAVDGMIHTLGLSSRRRCKAEGDAECVRLLRAAGAIPVALTNVPEVNKWQETRNMLFGQTNNPYHSGRTTGGSSGGEAALCAALASPISLCSDIGGSTRMPAFYCGLYALNPTAGYTNLRGLALRTGTHPSMASVGFLSRHLEDLVPLTKVVLGENVTQLNLDAPVDVKNIQIYYTETAHDRRVSPICPSLRKTMKKVISKLTEDALSTDKAPTKYYHEGFDHMFTLWRHEMTKEADCFAKVLTNNEGEAKALPELGKKILGLSQYTMAAVMMLISEQILPAVDARWAERALADLRRDLTERLSNTGVLLFPSAPAPAPYHYTLLTRPFNFAYWAVFNAMQFPAVQVPLGLDESGLPLGIQVVAAPKQEALAMAVAKHISEKFGGFVPPCELLKG